MKTLSIIGTAGRREDSSRWTKDTYFWMIEQTSKQIKEWNLNDYELVSGGAALADHIACTFFLSGIPSIKKLTLALPCRWDPKKQQYFDNGQFGSSNPGNTANYYHKMFSAKMGRNMLLDIQELTKTPNVVILDHFKGFFDRNKYVAKSDYCIAFTYGEEDQCKDGGTKHTFDLCKGIKQHFSLIGH